jgi:hypothetical protein
MANWAITEEESRKLSQYFREVTERLGQTGGNISAGFTFQSEKGQGRWEVIITHGNPGGRDSLQSVGVGDTFLRAMENAMLNFRMQ